MPAVPGADFVVIKIEFVLGIFEAVLDGPAMAFGRHPRALLTWALIAAILVSICSKRKVRCSSSLFAESSFSDRRPYRARSKAFRISVSRSTHRHRRGGPEIGDFALQSIGAGRLAE